MGVGRLKLRRYGGNTVGGVADLRRIDANGRVGGVDIFFVADRSCCPSEVLHVKRPDAFAGLTSPDGSRSESENVSGNCEHPKSIRWMHWVSYTGRTDRPVDETKCNDPLRSTTDYNTLLDFSIGREVGNTHRRGRNPRKYRK